MYLESKDYLTYTTLKILCQWKHRIELCLWWVNTLATQPLCLEFNLVWNTCYIKTHLPRQWEWHIFSPPETERKGLVKFCLCPSDMSLSSGDIRCLPFLLRLSLFTKADCLPELGRLPASEASLWGFSFLLSCVWRSSRFTMLGQCWPCVFNLRMSY